jgi:hypothetical protein
MDQAIETILNYPNLGLTATDRFLVLHLSKYPAGQRIEDIARLTGSKYQRVAVETYKLARLGVLTRTAPNAYAVNLEFGTVTA